MERSRKRRLIERKILQLEEKFIDNLIEKPVYDRWNIKLRLELLELEDKLWESSAEKIRYNWKSTASFWTSLASTEYIPAVIPNRSKFWFIVYLETNSPRAVKAFPVLFLTHHSTTT